MKCILKFLVGGRLNYFIKMMENGESRVLGVGRIFLPQALRGLILAKSLMSASNERQIILVLRFPFYKSFFEILSLRFCGGDSLFEFPHSVL